MDELLNNKELQALLSSLQEGETTEDDREQPLGKYGRMAMNHLYETNPQKFSLLKMTGGVMDLMYKIDEEATEMMYNITQRLLADDPMPKTDDIMVRTRHLNKHRDIAEEIVIREMVFVPR